MAAVAEELGAEAKFKLALMRAIDTDLKRRFSTLADAAEFADVDITRLYKIGGGRYEYFSVPWLFRLAAAADVRLRISVTPR